jgi:hypothetical protein
MRCLPASDMEAASPSLSSQRWSSRKLLLGQEHSADVRSIANLLSASHHRHRRGPTQRSASVLHRFSVTAMSSIPASTLRQRDRRRRRHQHLDIESLTEHQSFRHSDRLHKRLLTGLFVSVAIILALAFAIMAMNQRPVEATRARLAVALRRLGESNSSAIETAVHVDERYGFDGSHSDFAQQFFRLYVALGGDAGVSVNASAIAAPVAAQIPDEMVKYVQSDFGLEFESLPPLLQLATIWDSGFVAASALGYVRVRTRCGLRMSDLALSLDAYTSAGCVEQSCSAPDGEQFYQSLYCNGDQMSSVALCATTDGVAPVHAPMWSNGGADDTVPIADMAKHQWTDGGTAYTVFAIHLSGDPNSYAKCSLPSITIPCAEDDGSDLWCSPKRGKLVEQWLAHEQERQSRDNFGSGSQQAEMLESDESAEWRRDSVVVITVAIAAAVLVLLLIVVAVVWWRRDKRGKRAILGDDIACVNSWDDIHDPNSGSSCWSMHKIDFALEEPTIRTSRSFNLCEADFRESSPSQRGGKQQATSSAMSFSPLSSRTPTSSPPSSLRVVSAAFYPPWKDSGATTSDTMATTTTATIMSSTKDSARGPTMSSTPISVIDHEQSPLSSSSIVISSNPALDESFHGPLPLDSALHKLPQDQHVLALRVATADIRRLHQLAIGAYGEVWLGRLRGELVAFKRLRNERRRRSRDLEAFAAEILLMTRLAHPNILSLRGVAWTTLSSLCLVMEFITRGDLHRVLQREGAKLSWTMAKARLARDVARALAYLHARGVVHRDLKSKNVLVGEDLGAKLSDFGTSRYRSDKHSVRSLRIDFIDENSDGDLAMSKDELTMTAGVGTAYWTAPEVLAGGRYAEKVDVYSFGVVLSELDTCQLPFSSAGSSSTASGKGLRPLQVLSLVVDGELRPQFLSSCPELVRQLAATCLHAEPSQRPTAVELVEALDTFITSA